jgi:hypothetical protein
VNVRDHYFFISGGEKSGVWGATFTNLPFYPLTDIQAFEKLL